MRGGSWQWGAHCKSEGQLRSPMAPQCVHRWELVNHLLQMRMLAQPLLQNSLIQLGTLQQLHKFFRFTGFCILNLHRTFVSFIFEPHALKEELGLFELRKVLDVSMLLKLLLDVRSV